MGDIARVPRITAVYAHAADGQVYASGLFALTGHFYHRLLEGIVLCRPPGPRETGVCLSSSTLEAIGEACAARGVMVFPAAVCWYNDGRVASSAILFDANGARAGKCDRLTSQHSAGALARHERMSAQHLLVVLRVEVPFGDGWATAWQTDLMPPFDRLTAISAANRRELAVAEALHGHKRFMFCAGA